MAGEDHELIKALLERQESSFRELASEIRVLTQKLTQTVASVATSGRDIQPQQNILGVLVSMFGITLVGMSFVLTVTSGTDTALDQRVDYLNHELQEHSHGEIAVLKEKVMQAEQGIGGINTMSRERFLTSEGNSQARHEVQQREIDNLLRWQEKLWGIPAPVNSGEANIGGMTCDPH
jgi:hypothetical protein